MSHFEDNHLNKTTGCCIQSFTLKIINKQRYVFGRSGTQTLPPSQQYKGCPRKNAEYFVICNLSAPLTAEIKVNDIF